MNRSRLSLQQFLVHAVWIILFVRVAGAQTDDKMIYLNRADSLVGLVINGEQARKAIGDVKFTHGKTVVTCNQAIQYFKSNKITLEGEVVVTEDSMTMSAQHGVYYGDTRTSEGSGRVRLDDRKMILYADYGIYYSIDRKAYFRENVRLYDSSSVLTSDELWYYRDDQKTIAESNVVIVNAENHVTLSGQHFENYRKIQYSLMLDHPRSTHVDTTGATTDSLVIVSDTMETYQQVPERLLATGHVLMHRNDIYAQAGNGVFYTKLDSIELRGSPFVWQTQTNGITTQTSGDSMFIKLEKRKLRMMYVHGHAFSISEADSLLRSRYHQISGQDMTMMFSNNKVDKMVVDRTATILYYLFDDKTPNGLNNTTGDHVTITFAGGKVDKLKVMGGVEGKYVPERLVTGRELDYNLAGFNWKPKPLFK